MRLVIVSNMDHWHDASGQIVGHGATVRELDVLATLFDEVRHVACMSHDPPPDSALPYRSDRITLVPVPRAGGESLGAKLEVLRLSPRYVRTVLEEMRNADVIHVRCPGNVPLHAIALLPLLRRPSRRWVKYAGNWRPEGREPLSYGLQRWWLEHVDHRVKVTVNGRWPDQPAHVHTFLNPCVTEDELARGGAAASSKDLAAPLRLLYVGNLIAHKGPEVAIDVLETLTRDGVDATLDIVGHGPERERLRARLRGDLAARIALAGPLPRPSLDAFYARAHFVVLPSTTEGWPKVLAEGMAAGALPIATSVGSIGQTLAELEVGRALAPPTTGEAFAAAIREYLVDIGRWRAERERAVAAARSFSYSAYLTRVRALLDL